MKIFRHRLLTSHLVVAFALATCGGALAADLGATPADAFRLPEGFEAQLLYEVPGDEQGSWVAMTVDPQGRLITSDQYGGLYRITLSGNESTDVDVERLETEMGMAHGLLCAFDSLYVNVNAQQGGPDKSGIYRLRDTNGDDQYDQVEHLVTLEGRGEHGPHALVLSPDGQRIYFACGNMTSLPEEIERSRLPQNWSEDHLLGRMPDARGHNTTGMAPGGYIAAMDPDGSAIELVAGGFRNPYDIAFHPDGELFTYDSDMEWDVGTPWYRPTRVNHVTSGAEFGWRNGTGKWPEYYPDSLGAVVNIGPGSPTGVVFGTGAKFPVHWQRALFLADWSYGNIFAVHLASDGSGYTGTYETFATASPLPVTDLVIHPEDGAMYVTIGGRRTQSALYRIRYVGDEPTAPAGTAAEPVAAELRAKRHHLESFHGEKDPAAVPAALPYLADEDRNLRYAARIALEHQPLEQWREQVLDLDHPHGRINGIIGLARSGSEADRRAAISALAALEWNELPTDQQVDLLRAYGLVFLRLGEPTEEERQQVLDQLDEHLPAPEARINRELAQVLLYLDAPRATERAVALMESARTQEDQIHYAFALREIRNGWTPELRRRYFSWFNDVASARGGMSFGGFIENIRKVAVETLSPEEKEALADVLEAPRQEELVSETEAREHVREWTVEELLPIVEKSDHEPDFERGKEMFAAAQCFKCHRIRGEGGILGPDLTGAGGRFSDRDLLESIVEPNKEISDQYAATQFLTDSGRVVVGKVINLNANKLQVLTNMLDPSSITSIDRDEIEVARPAQSSMMPGGLIDTLTEEEILDLLAYLKSGGESSHPAYRKR